MKTDIYIPNKEVARILRRNVNDIGFLVRAKLLPGDSYKRPGSSRYTTKIYLEDFRKYCKEHGVILDKEIIAID